MDGITVYTSIFEMCAAYDKATQDRLVGAMARYALTGEEPEFSDDDPAKYIWPAMKQKAERLVESYEKKASAGKAGGDKRVANAKQTPSTVQAEVKQDSSTTQADSKQDSSSFKPETNTETNTETDTNRETKRARAREREARFERFWSAYPRKTAKQAAQKAFEKLDPDDDLLETILKALAAWTKCDQWTKDGGQFIPHPATWLNGKRWEDEVPAPRTSQSRQVPAQQYEQRSYAGEDEDIPEWAKDRWREMKEASG